MKSIEGLNITKTDLPQVRRDSVNRWPLDLNCSISSSLVLRLNVHPADFGFANLFNCMSLILKIGFFLYIYTFNWFCLSGEF